MYTHSHTHTHTYIYIYDIYNYIYIYISKSQLVQCPRTQRFRRHCRAAQSTLLLWAAGLLEVSSCLSILWYIVMIGFTLYLLYLFDLIPDPVILLVTYPLRETLLTWARGYLIMHADTSGGHVGPTCLWKSYHVAPTLVVKEIVWNLQESSNQCSQWAFEASMRMLCYLC